MLIISLVAKIRIIFESEKELVGNFLFFIANVVHYKCAITWEHGITYFSP